ncbi:aminotransferase class I/II-fold pyridoxal phosphate-dependent enzyme [Lacrimispora saccharolytica]|nr:aminotransferase class I/II-fold pyridoxal phosphate-dependent enzyme [Lacrimispora saccharolytica]
MKLTFSDKTEMFGEGIFAVLNEKKNEMVKEGKKIYNLSVGTPDFEPPEHIRKAVAEAALKPENYKYSLTDLPELTEAMQSFYQKRFGVQLEKNEIMSMNGSQEGMTHFAWALCNPGDVVLVPNPGYPIFKIGPELCDAVTVEYPLYEKNNFLPKLEDIPEETARKARFMVVSYPSNPVCSAADDCFYQELIAFAKKYDIMILHDNAYSDIVFDGKKGGSFLQYEGAKEVGVEFYSLSKSFNYTGARVSFCVGNAQIVEKFRTIRSQIDYGIFYPVQYGAIAALTGSQESVAEQCKKYERRSRTLCRGLSQIGWKVKDTQGTMFVWAPLPEGFHNSNEFCMELMEKSGVICTPGSSFGSLGEGYVRFALVLPEKELQAAVESIRKSGILN